MRQLIWSRKVFSPFLLSLAALLVAGPATAEVGTQEAAEVGTQDEDLLLRSSKTLRKRVVVKKADDDKPVPNLSMGDPGSVTVQEERWLSLRDSINRPHRSDALLSEVAPEDIRPWQPPTSAGVSSARGGDPLALQVNGTPSSAPGAPSVVNETSVAAVGDYVFYTANWYAAASTDGGETWNFVNPSAGPFPEPPGEDFCCNQRVHHDIPTNTTFWLQQMIPDTSPTGTQRVNVDLNTDGSWDCFYDLTPEDADFGVGNYPDYPDVAVSKGHLFVTSNVFAGTGDGAFQGAFVARLPLPDVTRCQSTMADFHTETGFGSFRTTQGAEDTMYFADHESTTSIRVWSWPDASAAPTSVSRTTNAWSNGTRNCIDPSGLNWCGFIDARLFGAAVGGDRVAFLWTPEENPAGGFPFPYTQGIVLDASNDLAVLEQPLIWSTDAAWIYPSLASNSNGDFGGTLLWGGGSSFPNCSAFLVDDVNGDAWAPFEHEVVIAGGGGAAGTNRSSDHLSTRVYASNDKVYAGSCFGYPSMGVGESRYVLFGRANDFLDIGIFADGFESGDFSAWSVAFQ
ncbi:MAG: hypothetical protein AAFY88_01150, partial [Acidobacteriota bacterium]